MKNALRNLAMVAAAATFVAAQAADASWLTSWDKAVKLSKKTGKPIMADFTGSDWCGWCMKLHSEVFDKLEFKRWAAKRVVLLELDYPHHQIPAALKQQNDGLARKYQIQGFPTVLFLDPSGKPFGAYGYDEGGPKVWTKKADEALSKRPRAVRLTARKAGRALVRS